MSERKTKKPKEDSYKKKKGEIFYKMKKVSTKFFSNKNYYYIQDDSMNKIKKNTVSKEKEKAEKKIHSVIENKQINSSILIKDDETFDNLLKEQSYQNNLIKPKSLKNKIKRIINTSSNETKNNLILITVIFFIFISFTYESKKRKIHSFSSDITVYLEGLGTLSVFYGGSSCSGGNFPRPNEIYINDIKQNTVNDKYDFDFPYNIIKLRWTNTFSNCNCLFKDCINIIEIDFSKFVFSSSLYAYQMFYNCNTLTSINLHPSTTITIYNLIEMFSYCESLLSID